jgi:hypothetical protein
VRARVLNHNKSHNKQLHTSALSEQLEGLSDLIWSVMLNAQDYINEGSQCICLGKVFRVPCKRHSAQDQFPVTRCNECEQCPTTTEEFTLLRHYLLITNFIIYFLFLVETLLNTMTYVHGFLQCYTILCSSPKSEIFWKCHLGRNNGLIFCLSNIDITEELFLDEPV